MKGAKLGNDFIQLMPDSINLEPAFDNLWTIQFQPTGHPD